MRQALRERRDLIEARAEALLAQRTDATRARAALDRATALSPSRDPRLESTRPRQSGTLQPRPVIG